MLRVSDYMTAQVVTADLNDGLHKAHQRMIRHHVRHLPVLGEDGRIAGILSDRDLLRPRFVDPAPDRARPFVLDNKIAVQFAMTPQPHTVYEADALTYALDLFVTHRVGVLPVIDAKGVVVGILSTIDVLDALRHHLN